MREVEASGPQLQMLTFLVGGEEFGLDVLSVQEVVRLTSLAPLAEAPAAVEGTLAVRGEQIPVIDLRRHFATGSSGDAAAGQVISVRAGEHRLGLIVDVVREVISIPMASLSSPPAYLRGLAGDFLRGIAPREERLVLLLDGERLLSPEQSADLARAMGWSGVEEDSFVP